MTKGNDGKVKVEKVGLKEVQRDGFEYELTLAFEIDTRHLAKASKDRTGLYMDKPEFTISEKTGEELKAWADSGKPVDPKLKEKKKAITDNLATLGYKMKTAEDVQKAVMEVTGIELAEDHYEEIIKSLEEKVKQENDKKNTPPAEAPAAPEEPPVEEVPAEEAPKEDKLSAALKKK